MHFCNNYKNTSITFNLADKSFANKTYSWYCGKKVSYDFCNQTNSSDCWNDHGEHGAGTIFNKYVGMAGTFKYLKLSPYDGTRKGGVVLFRG